jgi:hypothetical protein
MSRHQDEPLAGPALAALRRELDEVRETRKRLQRLYRRRRLLALTYIPVEPAAHALGREAVELDRFRLVALRPAFLPAAGGMRPVGLLTTHRARLDQDTATLRLPCERVVDLYSRGPTGPDLRAAPGLARAGVLLHQALEDAVETDGGGALPMPEVYFGYKGRAPEFEPTHPHEVWHATATRVGLYRAWPLRLFTRRPRDRHAAHPLDGTPRPWDDPSGLPDGARAGAWVVREGRAVPLAQRPDKVFVRFDVVLGRALRSPGYLPLKLLGLAPGDKSHRCWLESLTRRNPDGTRRPHDPDRAGTKTWELARALDARFRADALELVRALLWAEAWSDAAGAALPPDGPDRCAALCRAVYRPWEPAYSPLAARLHVVELGEDPAPENLVFDTTSVTVDLGDLGKAARLYPLLPGRVVAEAFGQGFGRVFPASRTARGGPWGDQPCGGVACDEPCEEPLAEPM